MIGAIVLGVFVALVSVSFGFFVGYVAEELREINAEIRELEAKRKARGD